MGGQTVYSDWEKKEPLLDIWDKPIFEGLRIKTLEKDKEYSQIGRRESVIGVKEEQGGWQCWVPNTTWEDKNRSDFCGYKKEGLFVILEKSKFSGIGKVEVWSQRGEDEKRECGDNEAFFYSGHLTVKEKKMSGGGQSLFKNRALGIIWPPGCKRICRPGEVLNYMTFKVLSTSVFIIPWFST